MTPVEAIGHTVRLLHEAEMHANPDLMGRYDDLATTWLQVAAFLSDNVEAQS